MKESNVTFDPEKTLAGLSGLRSLVIIGGLALTFTGIGALIGIPLMCASSEHLGQMRG